MPITLGTRLIRVAEGLSVSKKNCLRIERLVALYISRFITSHEYRQMVHITFPDSKRGKANLIEIKDFLDFSDLRNRLYRGVYYYNQTSKTSASLAEVARINKISQDDLRLCWNNLKRKEFIQLADRPIPRQLSSQELKSIMAKVNPVIGRATYKRLAFVFMHDNSLDSFDLRAHLQMWAIKTIRQYEVMGYTDEHLIRSAITTVKNQAVNVIEAYSRHKRSSLVRTAIKDEYRRVWYLDLDQRKVFPVDVRAAIDDREFDVVTKHTKIIVQDDKKQQLKVNYLNLFESLDEACEAFFQKDATVKQSALRKVGIDLNPKNRDKFNPTAVSLFSKSTDDSLALIDKLPAEVKKDSTDSFDLQEVLRNVPSPAREFIELFYNPSDDDFFLDHAEKRNCDVAVCGCQRLTHVILSYLNITKEDIKNALQKSPEDLWSQRAQKLIHGEVNI